MVGARARDPRRIRRNHRPVRRSLNRIHRGDRAQGRNRLLNPRNTRRFRPHMMMMLLRRRPGHRRRRRLSGGSCSSLRTHRKRHRARQDKRSGQLHPARQSHTPASENDLLYKPTSLHPKSSRPKVTRLPCSTLKPAFHVSSFGGKDTTPRPRISPRAAGITSIGANPMVLDGFFLSRHVLASFGITIFYRHDWKFHLRHLPAQSHAYSQGSFLYPHNFNRRPSGNLRPTPRPTGQS